jgi:Trk K+ transport system NAD-binding subunit
MTFYESVTSNLIKKLDQFQYPYVVLAPNLEEALRLSDMDIDVVVGELDDPETYRKVRVEKAAMVVSTRSDFVNTNVVSTVRGQTDTVPIIASARDPASIDILELAGATYVLRPDEMMGRSLARRTIGRDTMTHLIGYFDDLMIAEANVTGTPLIGTKIRESRLREETGVTIIGAWERGQFRTAEPEMLITPNTVLVLAGSKSQLERYDKRYHHYHLSTEPVIIIGGGRVGRVTGQSLENRGIDYRIIEKNPELVKDTDQYILGNAADIEVLEKAGIRNAPTVIITSHDDDTNIYLAIYCRQLRPDVQIISRATLERNVNTLHRVGADLVMSYASMSANTIFNLLDRSDILMVTEGLDVFKVKLPSSLIGITLANSGIRKKTGCNVVAIAKEESVQFEMDAHDPLPADSELILAGSLAAEKRFLEMYGAQLSSRDAKV